MVVSTIAAQLYSHKVSYPPITTPSLSSSFLHRNLKTPIISALPNSYTDLSASGLSSKPCGLLLKHEQKDPHALASSSYGPIEAKKGNPPIMPTVMTLGGPLDLSTVLFRNRIIFIGQPINSQVAQRGISQLVTLATIDEDADILIKPKIGMVCFGVAASQDALLLAAGEKSMQYAMPNARIMIHQPQSGCGGHVEDVKRQVNKAV